jgi:hypothetical protein
VKFLYDFSTIPAFPREPKGNNSLFKKSRPFWNVGIFPVFYENKLILIKFMYNFSEIPALQRGPMM